MRELGQAALISRHSGAAAAAARTPQRAAVNVNVTVTVTGRSNRLQRRSTAIVVFFQNVIATLRATCSCFTRIFIRQYIYIQLYSPYRQPQ